jgi:hypothetical protein
MSYLNLPKGIGNFSKAVISLWFRVPNDTVKGLQPITASSTIMTRAITGINLFPFTVPLITFGQPQTKTIYNAVVKDISVWHYTPSGGTSPIMALSDYVANGEEPINPSFVGLDCSNNEVRLVFNIQLGGRAPVVSSAWVTAKVDIYRRVGGEDFSPGSGLVVIDSFAYGIYNLKDVSYIRTASPETFHVRSQEILKPDTWHHLLLSFDVSQSCTVGQPYPSSLCKLWYAIDDVDYRGQENLQPHRQADDGLDPNAIVTENVDNVSGGESGPTLFFNQWIPAPSGDYHPDPIPTEGENFGIPASSDYALDYVRRVEMAEFQMWTGVTLDTAKTDNRRAFVDKDGKPVDPTKGTEDDPRTPAEKLLGKKPEVLIHGSANWKSGYNTGTLGVKIEDDGTITKLPDGQFKPTGGIEKYTPDPSLDETTA